MQGLTLGIAALIAVQGIGLQQADGSSHSRGIIDNEESGVISIEKHLHGSHHKSGIKIRAVSYTHLTLPTIYSV